MALTADYVEEMKTKDCPHGFEEVLTKPVNINKLIEVLQRYL